MRKDLLDINIPFYPSYLPAFSIIKYGEEVDTHCFEDKKTHYAVCQYIILHLDKDSVDDFITKWKPESSITIIIAILPKREERSNRREKAISNLHKLHDAGKAIYLIDKEYAKNEESVYLGICLLTNSLFYNFTQHSTWNIDYSDYQNIFEKGFIYHAQSEDYQFEKAFDMYNFIRNSHLSDDVHVAIDRILLTIYISHENELLVEQMKYLNNQFELANTKNLRWSLGYKYDEENDNFHCYAFFAQDQFPEYLEKE